MLDGNLKRTTTRYRDPVLWAWFEIFYISKRYQYTDIGILQFSLAVRLREHKQTKLNDNVSSYLLFVPSRPQHKAEF